jgi:DNA-binding transcriptional LysR family regulator
MRSEGPVASAVDAGDLRPLLTGSIAEAPSLVLVYPGNRYLPAKVRVFMEFFAEVLPRDGWWPLIAAGGGARAGREKREAARI